MTTEEYLSTIDALVVQPFPEVTYVDPSGEGGLGHHVRELQVSRDFWDDDNGQAWVEAEADLRTCLDDLAARLTARWGSAYVVDLGPYLSTGCEGELVPEPLDYLSQQVVTMQVWPLPDSGRWLALAIGQADKELPLILSVTLAEIGMGEAETIDASVGLDFARDPADAVRVATTFWSSVNRRDFLTGTGSGFAASAFITPVTRWLVTPADETADHRGGKQVGQADLDELRDAADDSRRWDSKYGGGNWKANSVTTCLTERAAPLLQGSFTDSVGRELFSVTSELARLGGWTAFDVGEHDAAQRHFIQALRLARAGGDVQLGCYVLTTMAMQSLMRGFASEAVDMAQGAYERAKGQAVPRVLAFTKLIESRAHARCQDPRAASRALTASEDLLGQADERAGDEPHWIDFYRHSRLSADAAEIFRDLKNPQDGPRLEQASRRHGPWRVHPLCRHAPRDRRNGPPPGPRSGPWTRARQPVRGHPRPRPVKPGQGLCPGVQRGPRPLAARAGRPRLRAAHPQGT
ncbi:hypothetical protein [Streptomyces sp. NPDC058385]|uniref:hypothetical protein n=1 Tax=Streptomyces sp. NPDC058385 TaxID=3346473 RepID=UPI00365F95B1